jgi:uncharacterized protein YbjT (DUF2867 family)
MARPRLLVTGASGTVGRAVVERLARAGATFRAGYSRETQVESARGTGLDAVLCDLAREETVADALSGIDRLFLLVGGREDQTALESAAVCAASAARVEHVVKLSVWGAAEESFGFARIHRPVERALEASGIGWTFLRPNGFLQNLVTHHRSAVRAGLLAFPAAEIAISHIDARDVADVAVACLVGTGHAGRAYELSGAEALTWREIAGRLALALGRSVRYVPLSEADARAGMLESGVPAWLAEGLLDLSRYYRAGHAARVTDDVRAVLGRDPIAFDTFLQDHLSLL